MIRRNSNIPNKNTTPLNINFRTRQTDRKIIKNILIFEICPQINPIFKSQNSRINFREFVLGAHLILNNSHRGFIEFLFEILVAARQSLANPEFLDCNKNMFYSSRFTSSKNIKRKRGSFRGPRAPEPSLGYNASPQRTRFDTFQNKTKSGMHSLNNLPDMNKQAPSNMANGQAYGPGKGKKAPDRRKSIPVEEKRLSQQDIANILFVSSRSFKNVKIPQSFFRRMVERDMERFKEQLRVVIATEEEETDHRQDIAKIYYSLMNDKEGYQFDNKSFYYFFKMNSSFEFWGMFDYPTFQERCKFLK